MEITELKPGDKVLCFSCRGEDDFNCVVSRYDAGIYGLLGVPPKRHWFGSMHVRISEFNNFMSNWDWWHFVKLNEDGSETVLTKGCPKIEGRVIRD